MTRWTLYIARWHPATLNQLLRSVRQRIRLKQLDRSIVMAETWQQKIPKAQEKRRLSLHIVLGPGQRAGDPDAYWKSVCDACTHAGLIVDDSHRYVELMPVTFAREAQQWGTVLTLEDLPDQDTSPRPPRMRRRVSGTTIVSWSEQKIPWPEGSGEDAPLFEM